MSEAHLVSNYPISAISIGRVYRQELGDLGPLCGSIRMLGLLHPIVITQSGRLVAGLRRLEAVKALGQTTIAALVAANLTDDLQTLLATQHENTLRKELDPLEAAALYAELKILMGHDAARRQKASRFGGPDRSPTGGGDSSPPNTSLSRTRSMAARAVTGRDSHTKLEQILRLQEIVDDAATPAWLRKQTREALTDIKVDGKVNGRYLRIRQVHMNATSGTGWSDTASHARKLLAASQLAAYAKRHFGWWEPHEPADIAAGLSEAQWTLLRDYFDGVARFAAAVRSARES